MVIFCKLSFLNGFEHRHADPAIESAHAHAPAHGNGSSFYDFFPVSESRLYWYSDVAAYLPCKLDMKKGLMHAALCTTWNMIN